jgi:hypothetical protein
MVYPVIFVYFSSCSFWQRSIKISKALADKYHEKILAEFRRRKNI